MDFKKYRVIKPFTIKVDKVYSTYKYDTYTFNVGDVVTIDCNFIINSNFMDCWTIRILDDRDLFFIVDDENKSMEKILNECVDGILVINLNDDDLKNLLAKTYNCNIDDVVFDISSKDDVFKVGVVIEKEE